MAHLDLGLRGGAVVARPRAAFGRDQRRRPGDETAPGHDMGGHLVAASLTDAAGL
jgi:hypothetical protein